MISFFLGDNATWHDSKSLYKKITMKFIITLTLLIVSNFGFAQNGKVDVPTIVFKVPLGKTIVKDGVSITLSEILEDSRCPSDVTCVWAGRSKVEVIIENDGKKTTEVVLFERGKQPVLASTKTCTFRAVKLAPYPTSATKGKMDYELLVSEEIIAEE